MNRPTECKWCGCSKVWLSRGTVIVFDCGSSWSATDGLEISTECQTRCSNLVIQQRNRIQRAVETLKAAKRYTVKAGPRNTLDWDPDPDGYVTDSPAVDEALAILEGERDGETWHSYAEPPSDTRSVMLRFDQAGNHDCQGFYSYDFGSYARSETNARRLNFVHPTHWRELTEGERDE